MAGAPNDVPLRIVRALSSAEIALSNYGQGKPGRMTEEIELAASPAARK